MRNGEASKGWFRLSVLAALFALIAMVAIACGDDDDDGDDGDATPAPTSGATSAPTEPAVEGETVTIEQGQPIKVGISVTLSGENAELGFPIRDAVQLAIRDRGPIKGFTIEGVEADDLCTGPGSETAAEQLISEGVVAVQGPMCSGGSVAAVDNYAAAGLFALSGSASAANVTEQGATNFARTAWNDRTQGTEMAKYVYETIGATNATLVDDQSTYGKGLMDNFEAAYEELGGTINGRQAVTVGEQDFSAVVTSIGTDPAIVVFGGYIAEGAALVRQLRDAGYTGEFMGADGIADARFIELAGDASDGAYISRGPQSLPNGKEALLARYHEEYGADAGEQFVDFAYDSMMIILNAIEEVGVVNDEGDMEINLGELGAAIKGSTLEGGASGTIAFLETGDRDISAGAVNQIDRVVNGTFERLQ
jgi:ABC-type branched-subunit amino acid transport system substrate-binding protein